MHRMRRHCKRAGVRLHGNKIFPLIYLYFAGPGGIEPPLELLESSGLPLTYGPICLF